MSDLINRQATIDAIKDYMVDPEQVISEYTDDVLKYNSGLLTAIQAIENLPSVQSETEYKKGCRNCRHGKYNDHWKTHFCYCPNDCNDYDRWQPAADGKDADVEPVIRCKDCIFKQDASNGTTLTCYCLRTLCYYTPEFYCGDGLRKTNI